MGARRTYAYVAFVRGTVEGNELWVRFARVSDVRMIRSDGSGGVGGDDLSA